MRKSAAFSAVLAIAAGAVFLAAGSSAPPTLQRADGAMLARAKAVPVDVLIRTATHDYQAAIAAVENSGGHVSRKFMYARGLAATVPVGAIGTVRHAEGVLGVGLDVPLYLASGTPDVEIPDKYAARHQGRGGIIPLGGSISKINDLDQVMRQGVAFDLESKFAADGKVSLNPAQVRSVAAEITPHTYADAAVMDALPVWASGNFGQDTIVAVIDSGVYGGHFMLDGSLIGCDDLTDETGSHGPDLPCSDPGNVFHGTHVASTIAGHGAVLVSPSNPISTAIARHGGPLLNGSSLGFPGANVLPLFGIAPQAQIYGIKVFRAEGGGASTSLIISAIEHAVDLKENGGVDIDVINMSLGGGTTYAGRDLESQAVDAATDAGITVVTAAGNSGPGAQTTESPGASQSAIAAGAIADPLHVRVFWDFNFFPSFSGQQLFVSDDPQMVYFSSRGDTGDGRAKPQISAPGTFILAAVPSSGNPNGIGFSSGTSMATPGIAGTVALLNTWSEGNGDEATPYDYLQALQAGAHPIPGFGTFEQGAGLNDAAAALAALQADGSLGDAFPLIGPPAPGSPVEPDGTLLDLSGGSATVHINNLAPGMQKHYYFPTSLATSKITVDSSHVRTRRNPFGINSFELYVKTATRSYEHYYVNSANVFGDAHFEIMDRSTTATGAQSGAGLFRMLIQPGYTRVTIENDWTSSGPISGTFVIGTEEEPKPAPDVSISGLIDDGGEDDYGFAPCPEFACRLDLLWDNDWTVYPSSDLDLILFGYDVDTGSFTFLGVGGATLAAPETNQGGLIPLVEGADPADVDFAYILVDGFDTHGRMEPYVLNYYAPAL